MADVSVIDVNGEVRNLKDTQARTDIAANANAIAAINEKIPSNASVANQCVTYSQLKTKWDKPPATAVAGVIPAFQGKYINSGSPLTWKSDRTGLIKIHYANVGAGYTISLFISNVLVDATPNVSAESDHGTLIGFVNNGEQVTLSSDATNNKIGVMGAYIQEI